MIDVALLRIGTDYNTWYAQTVAVLVDCWRHNMVVETTPIVPCQEDSSAVPIRSFHNSINQTCHVRLAYTHQSRGMLADFPVRINPGDGWQCAIFSSSIEIVDGLDVAE